MPNTFDSPHETDQSKIEIENLLSGKEFPPN